MSAFLCNADHIGEMSKFFANGSVPMASDDLVTHAYNMVTRERISFSSPQEVAEILARENIKSLQANYPDSWKGFFTWNPEGKDDEFDESMILLFVNQCQAKTKGYPRVNKKELYGMISCYRYQSCEDENWVQSDAYWLTQNLKDVVSRKLIGDVAMWEFRPEEDVA